MFLEILLSSILSAVKFSEAVRSHRVSSVAFGSQAACSFLSGTCRLSGAELTSLIISLYLVRREARDRVPRMLSPWLFLDPHELQDLCFVFISSGSFPGRGGPSDDLQCLPALPGSPQSGTLPCKLWLPFLPGRWALSPPLGRPEALPGPHPACSLLMFSRQVQGSLSLFPSASAVQILKGIFLNVFWPRPSGSVGWRVIPDTEKLWVRSPVRAYPWIVHSVPGRGT